MTNVLKLGACKIENWNSRFAKMKIVTRDTKQGCAVCWCFFVASATQHLAAWCFFLSPTLHNGNSFYFPKENQHMQEYIYCSAAKTGLVSISTLEGFLSHVSKNRLNWIKSTYGSETSRTGHSDVFIHEVTAELIHICSGCMFCGSTFLFECPPSTSSSDVWTNASGPKSYSLSSGNSNIEEILDIIQDHCHIYNSPIWIKT